MAISDWILLASIAIAQITGLIGTYVYVRVKLKELEANIINMQKDIKNNRQDFHIHEQLNEHMFEKLDTKLDKKIDNIYAAINEVKSILMKK